MMLPILISVSVAPGSYFFCALAALATATAKNPANARYVAWLKTRWCIIVLPDVLADGSCSLNFWGSLGEPSDQCRKTVCTIGITLPAKPLALISAVRNKLWVPARKSKGCQTKRAAEAHHGCASNAGQDLGGPIP